jgi:uncharacterized membrane protein
MVVVVVIVVVLALVVGVAWLVRRRGGDETHSVEGYRSTLDTLGGMRARTSTVRVIGQSEDASDPPRPPTRSLVFEDPTPTPTPPSLGRRGQDRAMSAMNHRPRRLGAPILVAAVVIVLLVVVVVIGARAQHHHSGATATTTTASHAKTTSTTGHAGTTTTAAHGTTSTTAGHGRTTTTTAPKATTTTVPASFVATTSTPTSATYVPPAPSYTLTLTATTGACWVTVKSSTGSTVFSQTLASGQTQSVPLAGASTIDLGAPSALTVTLDRKPVVLPNGYQTPFLMTFQPPGASSTGTAGTAGSTGTGTGTNAGTTG